jgi:hypothetical protein
MRAGRIRPGSGGVVPTGVCDSGAARFEFAVAVHVHTGLSANVREYGRPLSPVEAGADRPVRGAVHSFARPTAPTVGPVFVVLGAIQFTPVPGIRQHSPPLAPPAVLVTPDSAAPAPADSAVSAVPRVRQDRWHTIEAVRSLSDVADADRNSSLCDARSVPGAGN